MTAPDDRTAWSAPDACDVCGRINRRCRFGDPHGVCSCWRGEPCRRPNGRTRLYTDPPAFRPSSLED